MLMLIAILLILADTGIILIMLMVASLVTEHKPKSISEAQAELFKAWGDDIIEKTSK